MLSMLWKLSLKSVLISSKRPILSKILHDDSDAKGYPLGLSFKGFWDFGRGLVLILMNETILVIWELPAQSTESSTACEM